MNLISCAKCGVLLDLDRIYEPDIFNDDEVVISDQAGWNDDRNAWMSVIACPCCKTKIFYYNGGLKDE